jgi:hypothetical protein
MMNPVWMIAFTMFWLACTVKDIASLQALLEGAQ